MALRQRELKKNKNRLAIIRSAERSRVTIGPNQSVNVKGYNDKELEINSACAIIQGCRDSTIPESIDVTPTVIQFCYKRNCEINVNMSNLTTNTITVSPKAILCEVQPVTVNESVFEKLENETSKKVFERIHIGSTLTSEQKEEVETLLKKHIDVFSKHDSDIGDSDMI